MDRKALYTVFSLRFMLLAALYMLSFLAEPSSSSIAPLPVSLSLQYDLSFSFFRLAPRYHMI